jgi:hypothetical protein
MGRYSVKRFKMASFSMLYNHNVGFLSKQNVYDTFFKIVVDLSAQIPTMRIRFGAKAKQLSHSEKREASLY